MPPTRTPNATRGTIRVAGSLDLVKFTIRASPISRIILNFILDNLVILNKLQRDRTAGDPHADENTANTDYQRELELQGDVVRTSTVEPDQFWTDLQDICQSVGGEWADITGKIMAFGPQRAGGCMLIDSTNSCVLAVYNHVFTSDIHRLKHLNTDETLSGEANVYDYSVPLEAGFQLATFQGPLCAGSYLVKSIRTYVCNKSSVH